MPEHLLQRMRVLQMLAINEHSSRDDTISRLQIEDFLPVLLSIVRSGLAVAVSLSQLLVAFEIYTEDKHSIFCRVVFHILCC